MAAERRIARAPVKPFGRELLQGLVGELAPGPIDVGEVGPAQQAAEGARVVVLDVGVEQAEGREQAGRRRHDDARHAERRRHAAGEQRAVAAEGEQREVARVAAALGRDRLDGADHVGGGDQMRAVGRVLQRHAQRAGDRALEHAARLVGVERERAADEVRGLM